MRIITFRRYFLDKYLISQEFKGEVLDVGGKKDNKRGEFRVPEKDVKEWKYLNIDETTNPDYNCSAEAIPVKDDTFDMILMTEVLEHLDNPSKVLEELFRVLKQKGWIIATMPFLFPIHADPYDYQRWTPEKIRLEFENAGFTIDCIEPMGSIFAVIYDLLYVSLGSASNNRSALKNKIINRLVMPCIAYVFLKLDKIYSYKNTKITTGYFIRCAKDGSLD